VANPRTATRTRLLLAAAAIAGAGATALVPATASAAAPATVVSSNWSGYAVSAARFRRVSGSWKVAAGSCSGGSATYSAAWLGIGGFSETSQALEQTGTELDCSASGRAVYSAWYELVPSDAKTIRMTVRPGDTMSASVDVRGQKVSIRLRDVTRGSTFSKTLRMSAPDVTSAEWIVEAPAGCDSSGSCWQLPLADFGSVRFTHAGATSVSGHSGTISDSAWSATKMNLSQARSGGNGRTTVGSMSGALAAALSASGDAFSVSYGDASTFGKAATTMPVLKRRVG
jgi:hypothetical protein